MAEYKWISVKDRLPEESVYYLTYKEDCECMVLSYSPFHKAFNVRDWYSEEQVERFAIKVDYWMPLPELPKVGADVAE